MNPRQRLATAFIRPLCLIFAMLLARAISAQPHSQAIGALGPMVGIVDGAVAVLPPWRAVGLPGGKVPMAQLQASLIDGAAVLRVHADKAYGTLVHPIVTAPGAPAWTPTASTHLQWRWRVDQALAAPNLQRKDGDDAALKVCVMFDLPLDAVPFVERSLLRLARSVSGEALPSATVCYVWDHTLPEGTVLANAYSRRVRMLVVGGAGQATGQWQTVQRPVHADFLKLFGDEASAVPTITAVAVGADADNTGGQSLGLLADLRLLP